jgi:nicotinate-nucleotide pyrophosphorylase (carboxylating)
MITNNFQLNSIDEQLIDLALQEDLGKINDDITSSLLFSANNVFAQAKIISKNSLPFVLCGSVIIEKIITKIDSKIEWKLLFSDGQLIEKGQSIAQLSGPARSLLKIERTILNFLQHLSAVATNTKKYVDLVSDTQLKVLDTRKTTPGFRHLEKYAVTCGGGVNHRMGLYDAILIKDTHIDAIGGIEKALSYLNDQLNLPVIVEVRTLAELAIVLAQATDKVSRVLLDNMSLAQMREAVELCNGIIPTEASGNINLNNLRQVAETGVDYASIGKLTYAVDPIDLSMQCETKPYDK